jgi:undecaprenyl diphosphate synthase
MTVRTESSEPSAMDNHRKPFKVPVHVAIIMDGNGRWAQKRGLPRLAGHRVGVDCIHGVLETLGKKGVKYVTLYAFSTENWNRPIDEVEGILEIMQDALQDQTQSLHENNVQILHIGKADRLSPELEKAISHAQELTCANTGVTLNFAFDYGGRDEILEAVKQVIRDQVPAEDINEALFSKYLFTAHCPDPDLIIRTGGELRISNFLLWQSAYSEYYHTPTLWPDLDSAELERVLEAFSNRQRRFGRVTPEA